MTKQYDNRHIIQVIIRVLAVVLIMAGALIMPGSDVFADAQDAQDVQDAKADIPANILDNGIPIVSLTIDPEEYEKAIDSPMHTYSAQGGKVSIIVPEGYKGEYSETDLASQENLELEYFRGRGNSTWIHPKKPFKIKLDKSTDLLGMGANKHWVLLANAYDGALIRNRIVGYMGRKLGLEFTPMYTPVDLVINGEYRGSYTLAHQVRIGKNRVNIKELKPEDVSEPEVTGGYLLSYAPYGEEGEKNIFTTEHGFTFTADNPVFESDDPTETLGADEQREYIKSYLQQVEDAIYGDGFKDKNGVPYSDLMDIHTAAAYWMIQEFTRNTDAFSTPSTYLYKDRGGKLCWGPLWDSDLSFDKETGDTGFDNCPVTWLDYLRSYDPVYQEELRKIWKEYDQLLTDITKEGGLLDGYAAELAKSWEDNAALAEKEKWQEQSVFDDRFESLEDELAKIKDFIKVRQEWFNANIDTELTHSICKLTFSADGKHIKTVYARYQETLEYVLSDLELEEDYSLSMDSFKKEGYIAAGWLDENGLPVNEQEMLTKGMDLSVNFIPEEDAIYADGIYLGLYSGKIGIGMEEFYLSYSTTPYNAQMKTITWETSDPKVATVDERGKVTLVGLGEVTITGTLASGAKASCTVNVVDDEDAKLDPVTKIIPAFEKIALKPGESGQIPVTIEPNLIDETLFYNSSDDDIAMVDEAGVIRAVSPGTCEIKVRDYFNSVQVNLKVEVMDNSEEVKNRKAQLAGYIKAITRDAEKGNYTKSTVDKLMARIDWANSAASDEKVTVRDLDMIKARLLRAWTELTEKSLNTLEVNGNTVKLKAKTLKRKNLTVKRTKALKLTAPQGAVKYTLAGVSKSKFKKYFKVNKTTGKITVKKRLKKGKYTLKIKVTASGNDEYLPVTRTAKVTVRVR